MTTPQARAASAASRPGRILLALVLTGSALAAGAPAFAQAPAKADSRDRAITLQPLNPGAPNGSQINSDSTGKMRELNDPLTRRGADRGTVQEDLERRARLREEARQRELSTSRPTRPAPDGTH